MSGDTKHFTFRLATKPATQSDVLSRAATPNYPIEAYTDDMALVGRGTLRAGIDLVPGRTYVVSAVSPDGKTFSTLLTPETADSAVLWPANHGSLQPDSPNELIRNIVDDSSPWSAASSWASTPSAQVASPVSPLASTPSAQVASPVSPLSKSAAIALVSDSSAFEQTQDNPAASNAIISWTKSTIVSAVSYIAGRQLYSYATNLLRPKDSLTQQFAPSADDSVDVKRLDSAGGDRWSVRTAKSALTYVQLVESGQPVKNYAIPVEPGHNCELTILRSGSTLDIDITLDNEDADLLLRYSGRNMLQEAAQVAESPGVLAEDLLYGKIQSPIGAAVGAYVLLRLGELERLHDWTQNLCDWFPWLPDGAIIRAEQLARKGEHPSALKLLLQLAERGLPLFSSGLSYALNRLRQYRPRMGDQLPAEGSDVADALISQLGMYGTFTDFTRPILTFAGIDPLEPQRKTATRWGSLGRSLAAAFGATTSIPSRSLFRG